MRATFALLCFNQEKFVGEAVQAALAQTFVPLDIVISDDKSTDNTWEIIKAAVAEYNGPHKIRLIKNETNLGVGAHTDKILREAESEIVILAAGDDISLPNRSARIIEAFNDERVTCVASYLLANEKIEKPLPVDASDAKAAIMRGGPLLGATLAFRQQRLRFFPKIPATVRYGEDILLPFRAALLGEIAVIPDPLIIYRRHSASLMGEVGIQISSKTYVAGLKRTLSSLAVVRKEQIESVCLLHKMGVIDLETLAQVSAPILNRMEQEDPLRALLLREPKALLTWLRVAFTLRLTPKTAIKVLLNGLAPRLWHKYIASRAELI